MFLFVPVLFISILRLKTIPIVITRWSASHTQWKKRKYSASKNILIWEYFFRSLRLDSIYSSTLELLLELRKKYGHSVLFWMFQEDMCEETEAFEYWKKKDVTMNVCNKNACEKIGESLVLDFDELLSIYLRTFVGFFTLYLFQFTSCNINARSYFAVAYSVQFCQEHYLSIGNTWFEIPPIAQALEQKYMCFV